MLSDIEIAQRAEMYPIGKVAAELSIEEEDIEYYGHYKQSCRSSCSKSWTASRTVS